MRSASHPTSAAVQYPAATLLLVLAGMTAPLFAQQASKPASDSTTTKVRQIYVPADRMPLWPTNGEAYMPIKAKRLEQLLDAATTKANPADRPAALQAVLHASLNSSNAEGNRLLGHGALQIHNGGNTSWMKLDATQLGLRSAKWRSQQLPARIGYWGASQGLALEVPRSDWLDFDWQASLSSDPSNAGEFRLNIPPALATCLVLDLPADQTVEPVGDGTLVATHPGDEDLQALAAEALPRGLPPVAPDQMRWLLRAGPAGKLRWRLRAAQQTPAPEPSFSTYHEQLLYRVDETGVTTRLQFDISATNRLPRMLKLIAPDNLLVRKVEWDGELLPIESRSNSGYEVALPPTGSNDPMQHQLVVHAWHGVALDTMASLPQVGLPQMTWLSGKVQVLLAPSLQVAKLRPRRAVQVATPDALSRQTLPFEKLSPRGRIRLAVKRREAVDTLHVGRSLSLSTTGASGTVVTHWRSSSPDNVRLLSAQLGDNWQPRVVSATAPYQVDDWYIDGDSKQRRLVVRVSRDPMHTAEPADSMQLSVEAHRSIPASDGWLPVSDYDILNWNNASVADSWITFEVEDGYQLELNPPTQGVATTPTARAVLPKVRNAPVFDRPTLGERLQVFVSPAAAGFDAQIHTTVTDHGNEWGIAHRIECTPESGSIQHLRLLSNSPRSQILSWRIEGDDAWHKALPRPGRAARDDANPLAEYTFDLRRRQASPFVVVTKERIFKSATCTPESLELVGASHTVQRASIYSADAKHLQVAAQRWHLSAAPESKDEPLSKLPRQSVWQSSGAASGRQLVVSRDPTLDALPLASIVGASLTSTYTPERASQHRLEFNIDNRAESGVQCELPSSASDIYWYKIASDGSRSPVTESETSELNISLMSVSGQESIVVEYAMPNEPLKHAHSYTAPWPQLSIPAATATWTIRVPTDYRVASGLAEADRASWRQRLFGPLAGHHESQSAVVSTKSVNGSQTQITLPLHISETVTSETSARGTARANSEQSPATVVQMICTPTQRSRQCLLLLAAAMAGYALWRKPAWLLSLMAAASVAALLLPEPLYAWATAVWGGLLLVVALRSVQVATHAAREAWGTGSSRSLASTVATLLLLACCVASPTAIAQTTSIGQSDTASKTTRDDSTIEKILTPVDAEGRIAGDEQYITPRLLGQLLRREEQAVESGAWVASSPRYSGSLTTVATAATNSASVGRWQCSFDLQVLRAPAVIRLPFRQSDAAWANVVLLDGVPTPLAWTADGEALEFRVERAGTFRAKLEFHPLILRTESTWSIQLGVPPLPDGLLRLDAPSVTGIRINHQPLPTTTSENGTPQLALNPGSQILVQWPQEVAERPTARTACEQWEWLDVTAQRATINAVYHVESSANSNAPLELLIGGRSVPAVTSAAVEAGNIWYLTTEPTTTTLANGDREFRFRLAHDKSSEFGRLPLPSLSLSGTTTRLRNVALTKTPNLTVVLEGQPMDDEQSLQQLAEYWPDRSKPGQLVRIDRTSRNLLVTLRPVPVEPSVEESMDVCAQDDHLQVIYRGSFDYHGKPRFAQSLSVSPNMQVTSVEAFEAGTSTPIDWNADDGTLLVLFASPPAGKFQLTITGTVALRDETSGETLSGEVPRLTAAVDTTVMQQIALYAADHLTAQEVQGDVEPQLTETVPAPPEDWQAYGVNSFLTSSDRTTPLVILVHKNLVEFDANILATMIRQDNAWIAEFAVLLDVTGGILPEVVLDWPTSLVGTPEVSGSPGLEVTTEVVAEGRRVRVRFGKLPPTGGPLRIAMRSAVRSDATNRVACPVISVRNAKSTNWYFGELTDPAGTWAWRGVKPSVAPARIEGLLAAWPNARLLKATPSGTPRGTWTPKATDKHTYDLPMASMVAEQTSSDQLALRTQLVVPAFGVDRFDLLTPASLRLVQVTIDSQPALVTRATDDRVRLDMPDPHLPHLVEIVTHHELTKTASIEPPQLAVGGQLCKEAHRLWCIAQPPNGPKFSGKQEDNLTLVELAALRLNHLLAATVGAPIRTNNTAMEDWAQHWMKELSTSSGALRRALEDEDVETPELVTPDSTADEYDELLARATAELIRIRSAAGVEPGSNEILFDDPRTVAAKGPLWATNATTQQFVQSDAAPLQWTEQRHDARDSLIRWVIALGVVLVASAQFLTRQPKQLLLLSGYELLFPAVVAIGLVWWFCLWPRTMGLLLSAAAIVAWLRWQHLRNRSK